MNYRRVLPALLLLTLLVLPTPGAGAAAPARAATADVQAQAAALVAAAKLGKASCGVYVLDVDANRELVNIQGDAAFMPASNMKLVTTAAALSTLGPDFVFRTELRLLDNGEQGATLVVKGDGDPAFGDAKLLAANKMDVEQVLGILVKAVGNAGVKTVAKLILDDRIFDYQMTHPTWPAGQLHSWYCAEVSGLNFYDNCLDIYAQPAPGNPGAPARITILPDAPFLKVVNQTKSGGAGGGDDFLIGRKGASNDVTLSGHVKNASTEPQNLTVHDPAGFFAQVLADRLQRAGIEVKAIARAGADEKLGEGKTLHAIQTTLPAVLNRCNKDSQNLFAESLLKRSGYAATGKPGSWESGAAVVNAFLQKKVGLKEEMVTVADGSGMSRDDRVTPRALAMVLAYMHRDAKLGAIYEASLAAPGDGSKLGERLGKIQLGGSTSGGGGAGGGIRAKSGYINGVSTLSGYLSIPAVDAAGRSAMRTVAFSFLFNDVGDVTAVHNLQGRLAEKIDELMR